jgi:YHS domain-containing protein
MNRTTLAGLALAAAILMAGCSANMSSSSSSSPAMSSAAPDQPVLLIDLQNTKCPVTGDDVGPSKLTEVYDGKIYHFCCDDCPTLFKQDPAKYADLVAADPAKYGVKGK